MSGTSKLERDAFESHMKHKALEQSHKASIIRKRSRYQLVAEGETCPEKLGDPLHGRNFPRESHKRYNAVIDPETGLALITMFLIEVGRQCLDPANGAATRRSLRQAGFSRDHVRGYLQKHLKAGYVEQVACPEHLKGPAPAINPVARTKYAFKLTKLGALRIQSSRDQAKCQEEKCQ